MQRQSASSPIELSIELEIGCIRELSRGGRHSEALAAAVTLAARAPQDRDVLYLIAANQRCVNRVHEALETLQRLAQYHPRFSLLHQERGYCYFALRDAARAMDAFLRAVDINPALAASWSMLERLYRMAGDIRNTAAAAQRVTNLKHLPPEVVRAGSLFSDGDLSAAEDILRAFLIWRKTCGASWNSAALNSNQPASSSTSRNVVSARQAQSRSGSPFSAAGSSSGGTTNVGSARSRTVWTMD